MSRLPGRQDVRVVFRKWGERPHWEFDAVRLGKDEHGSWLGGPPGTRLTRPGADFLSPLGFVVLVPEDDAFVATFYAPGSTDLREGWVEVYVDISTAAVWDGSTVSMVDLDLDVVRGRTGRVWVDDEEEFAAHRTRFGYPHDIVRLATTSCDRVVDAMTARRPPYDGLVGASWISRLLDLPIGPGPGCGC